MVDQGKILSAVNDYTDAKVGEQKAADQKIIDNLNSQITELQQYKDTHPDPDPVPDPEPVPDPVPVPDPEPVPDPVPTPTGKLIVGMSAPRADWDTRLAEVGGKVYARRIFGNLGSTSATTLAASEIKAGRYAITSFKVPNNDWKGAAQGKYDGQIKTVVDALAALKGNSFVALHHEPSGDGTPTDFAAMQRHCLPLLKGPSNVDAGVIVNGFWWSKQSQGLTDAEIAQWLPKDVLDLCEVVASDCYQGGTTASPGENAGVKIAGMAAWAKRVGVKVLLGIGEFNGLDGPAIKAAADALLAAGNFKFAACFNSAQNNRAGVNWVLTGDRLTTFKSLLAASVK